MTFHDFGWSVYLSLVLKELRYLFFINDTVYETRYNYRCRYPASTQLLLDIFERIFRHQNVLKMFFKHLLNVLCWLSNISRIIHFLLFHHNIVYSLPCMTLNFPLALLNFITALFSFLVGSFFDLVNVPSARSFKILFIDQVNIVSSKNISNKIQKCKYRNSKTLHDCNNQISRSN